MKRRDCLLLTFGEKSSNSPVGLLAFFPFRMIHIEYMIQLMALVFAYEQFMFDPFVGQEITTINAFQTVQLSTEIEKCRYKMKSITGRRVIDGILISMLRQYLSILRIPQLVAYIGVCPFHSSARTHPKCPRHLHMGYAGSGRCESARRRCRG